MRSTASSPSKGGGRTLQRSLSTSQRSIKSASPVAALGTTQRAPVSDDDYTEGHPHNGVPGSSPPMLPEGLGPFHDFWLSLVNLLTVG
jgi:hypothetical protein